MRQVKSGATLAVEATGRADAAHLADGTLATTDNLIDTTTGTLKLRAEFDNSDGALFPGQFVNVSLLVTTLKDQVIVPAAAVRRGAPNGVQSAFVYLVNANNTVSVRPVVLGVVDGETQAVNSGVDVNDVVVTDGGDRLRDGAQVRAAGCDGGRSRQGARPGAGPAQEPSRKFPDGRRRRNGQFGRPPGGFGGRRAAADLRAVDRRDDGCDAAGQPMNPSRIFVLRPVATTLLMVAILVVGMIGYTQLPLAALPEVSYPTIQVQTFYPGASPEVITSAITAPLEKQFGQMPGLNQMSSTSSAGASVITMQFSLALAIDIAEQEVQAAISGAPEPAAPGPARAADLRQGQSRRRTGADPRSDLRGDAADAGRGHGRHPHRRRSSRR